MQITEHQDRTEACCAEVGGFIPFKVERAGFEPARAVYLGSELRKRFSASIESDRF